MAAKPGKPDANPFAGFTHPAKPSLASISEAFDAGDYNKAIVRQHLWFACEAIETLARGGFLLLLERGKLSEMDYIHAAAAIHRKRLSGLNLPQTLRLCVDLLALVSLFFSTIQDNPDDKDDAYLMMLSMTIGATAMMAGIERSGIAVEAQSFRDRKEKDRRAQALAAEKPWYAPGKEFCRERYAKDPTISDMELGRLLERALPKQGVGVPQREQIIRAVAAWRRDPLVEGFWSREKKSAGLRAKG